MHLWICDNVLINVIFGMIAKRFKLNKSLITEEDTEVPRSDLSCMLAPQACLEKQGSGQRSATPLSPNHAKSGRKKVKTVCCLHASSFILGHLPSSPAALSGRTNFPRVELYGWWFTGSKSVWLWKENTAFKLKPHSQCESVWKFLLKRKGNSIRAGAEVGWHPCD